MPESSIFSVIDVGLSGFGAAGNLTGGGLISDLFSITADCATVGATI